MRTSLGICVFCIKMNNLLESWGVSQLIPVFEEQQIDEDSLPGLTENMLKEIIPIVGIRAKFMKELKQYLVLKSAPIILIENEEKENTLSTSASSSTTSEYELLENNVNISNAFVEASKREKAFYGQKGFERSLRAVYKLNIKVFLEKTYTGQSILNYYNQNKQLTRRFRSTLTHLLIVGSMTENKGRLIPLDFEILAEKIVDEFPTENKQTYYIKRVPKTSLRKAIHPKGKLLDKYRNLRRTYKLDFDKQNQEDENILCSEISESIENDAEWLKLFDSPWETVCEKWRNTLGLRKTAKTAEEIIFSWPILLNNKSYTLIDMDFQLLYACNTSLVDNFKEFEIFFNNLISLEEIDTSTSTSLLSELKSNIHQDSKNAIQFSLLSTLLPPHGRHVTKKGEHWKPTTLESQESIIILLSSYELIEASLNTKKARLEKWNVTFKPFLVVVGCSFTAVNECYIVINNNILRLPSVLQGIDTLFKTFFVLKFGYPLESKHIWILLEKYFYKLNISEEIPYIERVLSQLNILKQN